MKTLIVCEVALLYFGGLASYARKDNAGFVRAVGEVGIRSGLGCALLLFVLLLMADLGAEGAAALFGAIVAFSYLTAAVDVINAGVDMVLGIGEM